MKLIALQEFSWAHQHVDVKTYAPGDVIETDDQDLIDVALAESWAKEDDGKSVETKAKKKLPSAEAD